MELYQWNAYSEGAAEKRRDDLAALAQGAFLVAYWSTTKNPKKLKDILNEIYGEENETKSKPDVDVDAFLEQKRRMGING